MNTQALIAAGEFQVDILERTITDTFRGREIPLVLHAPVDQDSARPERPVAVISHGVGETGTSMSYPGRHLALHGFFTTCPTHRDSDRQWVEQIKGERDYRVFGGV
ncbi:hypothetical protein GF407_06980 [candidate division KSB1 bacterium]|nr:hypothetical protein [candidate division KSB1 bacterium]